MRRLAKRQAGTTPTSEPATLQEVLATAHQSLDEIEHNVHDYSAVIIKKERIGTRRLVKTVMFAKIREKPFSVYLNFLDRSDKKGLKGREVIYVQGRNDDKLIVHTPGLIGQPLARCSWIRERCSPCRASTTRSPRSAWPTSAGN